MTGRDKEGMEKKPKPHRKMVNFRILQNFMKYYLYIIYLQIVDMLENNFTTLFVKKVSTERKNKHHSLRSG